MKRKEAFKILELYNDHLDRLDEARKQGDQDEIAIREAAIRLMESDYTKASKIVEKWLATK